SLPLFWLAEQGLRVLVWGAHQFAHLPAASLRLPTPHLLTLLPLYATLFSWPHLTRREGRLSWKAALLLLGLSLLVFRDGYGYYRHSGSLRVTFLDVGQGEAALLEFPNGKTMLIDGGGSFSDDFDMGEMVVAPFLWDKGMRRIDILVLSHPHADHLKGLLFLLDTFQVGQLWDNGSAVRTPSYLRLRARAEAKGIYHPLTEPTTFPSAAFGGVEVQVLHPSPPFTRSLQTRYAPTDDPYLNNRSLVLRLRYGEVSFLFTGDLEETGEQHLVEAYRGRLRTTVLKVPHHGSRTSSSLPFLQEVQPAVAVISVGAMNWLHYPHPQVLRRYQSQGIRVLRTDRQGAITIETTGQGYRISTSPRPSLFSSRKKD
ncbi:MAG: MBL fold metallo-hydrolase, partial [Nitrospinota bacterium]